MQQFRVFLDNFLKLSDEEWNELKASLEIRHFKKGELITFENDIWTDYMFLNTGVIRSFIVNHNGKDYTRQFYYNTEESHHANLFIVDLTSLLTKAPSVRQYEVLEACEVVSFSKDTAEEFFSKSASWGLFGRKMMELAYLNLDLLYEELLTKTTIERYFHLVNTMSGLIDKVPQYHIATYLGVTPVSLSRIKKELRDA